MGLQGYIGIGAAIAFGVLYLMYQSASSRVDLLTNKLESAYAREARDKEKITSLAKEAENNKRVYEKAQALADANLAKLDVLNKEILTYRNKNDELVKLFSDHNFTRLFKAKPGLVIKRMQSGTDRVFLQLEEATK